MKKTLIVLFLIFFSTPVSQGCYLIRTEVGLFTPVYEENAQIVGKYCPMTKHNLNFNHKIAYIGCYKTKKEALRRYLSLKKNKFNFKNAKIVSMKPNFKTTFVIFPYLYKTSEKKLKSQKRIFLSILNKLNLKKIRRKIPKKYYGKGIVLTEFDKFALLPIFSVYPFYKFYNKYKLKKHLIVLYNGVYSIDYLYKFLNKKSLIDRIDNKTYAVKVPIYIAPNASLVINNKTVLLETNPKPIFIIYNGNLYINQSNIFAWDMINKRVSPRKKFSYKEALLLGIQQPRPFLLGMADSKSVFLNSDFNGLGFHDKSATYGISLIKITSQSFTNNIISSWIKQNEPNGVFIGNTIHNNMFGFYTHNAKNVILAGNYFYNNLIYNIDPHDYSSNLIIARNIEKKAIFAHGIVLSRGVKNSFIAQNIALDNKGNGIMIDRSCSNNIIYNNLILRNELSGISLQESDNNTIQSNIIEYNNLDGVIARNSLNILIYKNKIISNGKDGIELLIKNIDNTIYRNFARDPYHKASSATASQNRIKNNLNFQLSVKNNAAFSFYENSLDNKSYLFGNDLAVFSRNIYKNHFNFKIYGLGNTLYKKSTDLLKISRGYNDIMKDLFNYNKNSAIALGEIYKILNMHGLFNMELHRASSYLIAKSLTLYAFYNMNVYEKNMNKIRSFLFYLTEAAVMGDKDAMLYLNYIKYIFPITKEDINNAYTKVIKHMQSGRIFLKNDNNKAMCKLPPIKKSYLKYLSDLFVYKMRCVNINDFYLYMSFLNRNYSLMPKNIYAIMKDYYNKINSLRIKYYNTVYLNNKKMLNLRQCRKKILKKHYIIEESQKIINERIQNDNKIKNKIKKYLKLINMYRINKISEQELSK